MVKEFLLIFSLFLVNCFEGDFGDIYHAVTSSASLLHYGIIVRN